MDDAARRAFWAEAREHLDGLPGGRGLNIAHETVDRHACGAAASRVALRFLRRGGVVEDVTYAALRERTSRVANALADLGVGAGDRVFVLLGHQPELYDTVLGALKHRCVVSPLFAAFGPEPVCQRLAIGDGRVLVTTRRAYERKVAPSRQDLPGLAHVLLVDGGDDPPDGTLDLATLLAAAADRYEIGPTDPEDVALLHFTSGTTGAPKGALHVHGAVVAHHATATGALGLRPDDVFWCTADPGWVTGISYGVIAPLSCGVTSIVDEGEFDSARWYRTLEEQRVTVWYTAPTAIRRLMRAGDELLAGVDLTALRFVASVGEPLGADAVAWGERALGRPIHDTWWQTETGGIMIANQAGAGVRPGSMGRPIPGIEAAILAADDEGGVQTAGGQPVALEGDATGHLALRPGWPSMFRGYLNDDARYRACFVGDWYVTGDLARRDGDGWFWFLSRADDIIKTAGHMVGPVEVEQALQAHPAVAEAGVVGVPDEVAGQLVAAFVALRPGFEPSDALARELIGFARERLGAALAPRTITFRQDLPKTFSGKVMRRALLAEAP
jgi:acetyl-CoA synthetase